MSFISVYNLFYNLINFLFFLFFKFHRRIFSNLPFHFVIVACDLSHFVVLVNRLKKCVCMYFFYLIASLFNIFVFSTILSSYFCLIYFLCHQPYVNVHQVYTSLFMFSVTNIFCIFFSCLFAYLVFYCKF